MGYQESFTAGNAGEGAYVCQLVIATGELVLTPGGPAGAFVVPAAREHAAPVIATAAASTSAVVQRLPLITGHPPFTVKGANKGKPGLDRAEFVRQLTNQQEGLNRLTVAQFLANRTHYEQLRKLTRSGRDPKGDAAQKVAREKALAEKVLELRRQDRQLLMNQTGQRVLPSHNLLIKPAQSDSTSQFLAAGTTFSYVLRGSVTAYGLEFPGALFKLQAGEPCQLQFYCTGQKSNQAILMM